MSWEERHPIAFNVIPCIIVAIAIFGYVFH